MGICVKIIIFNEPISGWWEESPWHGATKYDSIPRNIIVSIQNNKCIMINSIKDYEIIIDLLFN